jgi:hypothetical protein
MKGDIIPNGEFLYKYVKPETFPDDQTEIPFGIFQDESLSCDWAAIQKNPERSFHIAEGKNLIVRISVCDEIKFPCNPEQPRHKQPAWEQKIEHDPIAKGEDQSHPDIANPSHSLINGKKKNHITKAIARNSVIYKKVVPGQNDPIEEVGNHDGETTNQAPPNFLPGLIIAFVLIAIIIAFIFILS